MKFFRRRFRLMASVPRWVIVRTIQKQSIAEHSYFVIMYVISICKIVGAYPQFMYGAIHYAAEHDVEEVFSGDIPASVEGTKGIKEDNKRIAKKYFGLSAVPSSAMVDVVKLADYVEAYFFLEDEKELGNQIPEWVIKDISDKLMIALDRVLDHFVESISDTDLSKAKFLDMLMHVEDEHAVSDIEKSGDNNG